MSLIFVKNKDNSVNKNRPTALKPYRFTNYFTIPLKIPPNAQIAYVSSTFKMDSAGYLQGDPFYVLIGDPLFNSFVPLYQPTENIEDWDEGINLLGALVNQYGFDGDYNDIFYEEEKVFNQDQISFTSGNNFYLTGDSKVNLRTSQRTLNDTFNQTFNCCGANPALTYSGAYIAPAGINFSNNAYYPNDLKFEPINTLNQPNRCNQTAPLCFSQLPNSSALLPITTTANFYNTQYGWYEITENDYNWANNSALNYKVWDIMPFDEGFYPAIINNTSIKKNVNFNSDVVNGIPTDNGGGHATISKLNKFSGGYGIHSFRNISQALAKNHYDTNFMNSSGQTRTTGFCGISPQFFGVIPTELVYGASKNVSEEGNKANFINSIDLNSAVYGVDDPEAEIDRMNPYGATARYIYGVRIYEIAGSLIAQAQILDPKASLLDSKYIDVGFPLDIYKLSKGIIPNLNNGDDYTFRADANFRINIHNADVDATASSLFFRFRWTTPYCMNIEYTLSVEGEVDSYNVLTDAPYDFADYDDITVQVVPVGFGGSIALTNTNNGSILSFPVGNSDTGNNPCSSVQFTDSGGTGGPYQPNENYEYTFDAGSGRTIDIEVTDFQFEHTSFSMYDRLSIRVSNDGITYNNIAVPWFNASAVSTFPYSQGYIGGTSQTANSNGYIFPEDPSIAVLVYRDFTGNPSSTLPFPQTINTGFRYVKFGFTSDASSQLAGWDLRISTSTPITVSTTNYTADPTREWVCLFSMENYNRTRVPTQDKYLIPAYLGDLGLVQYPTVEEHSVGRKGYFDIRKSYRYDNRIQELQKNANEFNTLVDLPYFTTSYTDQSTYVISNTVGKTYPPKLTRVNRDPETFTQDGHNTKQIKYLLNTIEDKDNLDEFLDVNGYAYFQLQTPVNLELGTILGLTTNDITGNYSVVTLNDDIDNTGTPYILYGFNGNRIISNGDLAFNNHIQIQNLPIQSQNGVKSTMTKTVYVINSLGINRSVDLGSSRIYGDTAPHLLWIDLNNYGEMNINELSILITNDDNVEQKMLVGYTDIVFMIRQKPKEDEGYIPNNIPVRNTY